MILDFDNEFSKGVSPLINAATVLADQLDAGAGNKSDYGVGAPQFGYFAVREAFNNLTSLTVDIIAADDAALATNPVVLSTTTVLLAALTLNSLHPMSTLKVGFPRRFLGAKATPTGIAPTTGKIICGLRRQDAFPRNDMNP